MKRRDFPALTGLRFFLALWVILHHLTGPGQKLEATALLLPHPLFTLDSRRLSGGHDVLRAQRIRADAQLRGDGVDPAQYAAVWRSGGSRAYIRCTC